MDNGIHITDEDAARVTEARPSATPGTKGNSGASASAAPMPELIDQLGINSELSASGAEYKKQLITAIREKHDKAELIDIPDHILDICAIKVGNSAVALTFAETYTPPHDAIVPPTECAPEPIMRLNAVEGANTIIHMVIKPKDYPLVGIMATFISNLLTVNSGGIGNIGIDSLQSGKYSISTDISDVRKAIKKFNPKATMPRTDIGLVLYATQEYSQGYNNKARHRDSAVLVVGAYTSFVRASKGQVYNLNPNQPAPKDFFSVVTITSVFSPIMAPEMLSLALPLASGVFIGYNGWIKPYQRFSKTDQNLGNLIINEKTGKPFSIKDNTALNDFINTKIYAPFLAMDITEGLPRIPGVDDLCFNDQSAIQSGIMKFLGGAASRDYTAMPLVHNEKYREFIGEVGIDSTDSRCVDYMTLITDGIISDPIMLEPYLHMTLPDPQHRAQLIAKTYTDLEVLYTNTRVIFDSAAVEAFGSDLSSRFKPLLDQANAPEYMACGLTNGAGNTYGSTSMFNTGVGGNYFNGSASNPFAPMR